MHLFPPLLLLLAITFLLFIMCDPNWAIYQNGIREQEIANRGVATWGNFLKLLENAIKVARKNGSLVQDLATFSDGCDAPMIANVL